MYGLGSVIQWTPTSICSNGICQNGYPVTNFAIGKLYNESNTQLQYFADITTLYADNSEVTLANVKPNYQGLGLPFRFWAQIVEYIK